MQKGTFTFLAACLLAGCCWIADAEAAVPEETAGGETATQDGVWTMKRWPPYAVGAGIGILSWFAFLFSDKPLGVSTAYERTAGMIEEAARGSSVREKEYYQRYVPKIDWEWMFVAGLFGGALLSALLSGDFRVEMVPPMWEASFGDHAALRWLAALIGGVLLGIGARWADGCTSGHGISGTLQLVVSSWVAVLCFFAGGVVTARLIHALRV